MISVNLCNEGNRLIAILCIHLPVFVCTMLYPLGVCLLAGVHYHGFEGTSILLHNTLEFLPELQVKVLLSKQTTHDAILLGL